MAARTAVAEMHARLIADVSQYDAEMKRAAAITQRTVASIDGQMGKLQRDLSRKFSAGEIGKDILKGIGFGSGFAVAQTAAEQLVGYYREQAEAAREIEASVERQLELTRQIIALRQTPEQQVNTLENERSQLQRELDRYNDVSLRTFQTPADVHGRSKTVVAANTPEQVKAMQSLTNRITELDVQIAKMKAPAKLAEIRNALTDFFGEMDSVSRSTIAGMEKVNAEEQRIADDAARSIAAKTAGLKMQEDATADLIERQKKANEEAAKAREELQQAAEKYRQMADPMRMYRLELQKIAALEADSRSGLTAIEAAAARAQIIDASPAGQAFALAQQRFAPPDVDVKALTAETEALRQAAGDMGFAFSSAFEDAVLEGEKLSSVMRSLAQDVLRVFLRLGVTNPMINTLFGASGLNVGGFNPLPALFGGPKAAGGPVAGGTPYLVGERGPELFVPSATGKIVPNHQLGESRAVVVHVSQTFQSGVTRQEVAGLLPQLVDASKNAVLDAVNRGGAYRRGFAS